MTDKIIQWNQPYSTHVLLLSSVTQHAVFPFPNPPSPVSLEKWPDPTVGSQTVFAPHVHKAFFLWMVDTPNFLQKGGSVYSLLLFPWYDILLDMIMVLIVVLQVVSLIRADTLPKGALRRLDFICIPPWSTFSAWFTLPRALRLLA